MLGSGAVQRLSQLRDPQRGRVAPRFGADQLLARHGARVRGLAREALGVPVGLLGHPDRCAARVEL